MKWMLCLMSAVLFLPVAHAEPWLCDQPDGTKQFSYEPESARMKSCVHHPIPSGNVWRARPSGSSGAEETPANFPKVDRKTQKQRDAFRREILLRELAEERKSLAVAVSALAEQKQARVTTAKNPVQSTQRLKPYEDRVRVHQTNIANLQKELGGEG